MVFFPAGNKLRRLEQRYDLRRLDDLRDVNAGDCRRASVWFDRPIRDGRFSCSDVDPMVWLIGAVIISLQAVFERREDWDPAYNYWHLARPLVGAVLGVMSFLILSVIVTLAGSNAPSPDSAPAIANMNIYHVLAFIVGYREETFRDLLKRVTDLILRPGGAQDQQ